MPRLKRLDPLQYFGQCTLLLIYFHTDWDDTYSVRYTDFRLECVRTFYRRLICNCSLIAWTIRFRLCIVECDPINNLIFPLFILSDFFLCIGQISLYLLYISRCFYSR